MKNNFKIFKKTLVKSILAGFVASFAVLSCAFFCCSAMNAGDDPVDDFDSSDVSIDSDEFTHEVYDILGCQSVAEKKQKFSEIINKHPSHPEKYGKKLIDAANETMTEANKIKAIKGNDTLSGVDIYEIAYATIKGQDITPDMFENNSNNETNPRDEDINREEDNNNDEEEEDKSENTQTSESTCNNAPLKPKELAEIEDYQLRFMWDPSSC